VLVKQKEFNNNENNIIISTDKSYTSGSFLGKQYVAHQVTNEKRMGRK